MGGLSYGAGKLLNVVRSAGSTHNDGIDKSFKKLVAEVAKTVGSDIKVGRVVRFEVGEGIEKKEENFAEEVAKQLK